MLRYLLSILAMWVTTTTLQAQPSCTSRTFNIHDGLAANIISRIVQTPDQLIWLGTWNGLCCYDGYRFTTFRDVAGQSGVLSTNRILSIRPNKYGDLWTLTYDHQLYLFDTKRCKFENVNQLVKMQFNRSITPRNIYSFPNGHTWAISNMEEQSICYRITDSLLRKQTAIEMLNAPERPLRIGKVMRVELDGQGREWIEGTQGVYLLRHGKMGDKQIDWIADLDKRTMLASKKGYLAMYQQGMKKLSPITMPKGVTTINSLKPYPGAVLAATNIGIVRIDSHGKSSVIHVQQPAQPSAEVKDLFVDSRRRIWAFTAAQGVILLPSLQAAPIWLQALADSPENMTNSLTPFMVEDWLHTVWVIPTGGTYSYYDEQRQQLVAYPLKASNGYGRAVSTIERQFTDSQGNLWVCGSHDLTLINFNYQHSKHMVAPGIEEVRSVTFDHANHIWTGSANGILTCFNDNGRLLGYLNPNGRLQPSPITFSNKIYMLYEDRKHRLWIGTKGQGLFCLLPNGELRHYLSDSKDPFSINSDEIYAMDEDTQGRTWIATFGKGLNYLQEQADGSVRFIHSGNLLAPFPNTHFNKIRRITHTPNGVILVSTTGGLVTFSDRFHHPKQINYYTNRHQEGDTTSLRTSDVFQTLVCRNGNILVCTLGGGLQIVCDRQLLRNHLKLQTVGSISMNDGLVQSMTEDQNKDIWIIRETTVNRMKSTANTSMFSNISQFGPNDLTGEVEFTEAQPACNQQTGSIAIGTMKGCIVFHPKLMKKYSYTPNIVFTSVTYQGETEPKPILNVEALEVPSDMRNMTIAFAALDYSDNELVKYAYWLEGADDQWNFVGNSHIASLSHLKAGHYRLHVKSTNNDGVWVDNERVLDIHIQPTFWESWWGKLIYLLIIAGLIYLGIYIYMLRTRNKMEKEMNELKTQFFTSIGHKLRTPLTLIGGPALEILNGEKLSDNGKKYFDMIERNAQRMLQLVNNMLAYSKVRNMIIDDQSAPVFARQEVCRDDESDTTDFENTIHPRHSNLKLLIVEDNDDLRAFLVSILCHEYLVIQAENGQQGLEITKSDMPDFIITDVMMPIMDGLTMIHQIKQNNDICHIPIIVLSAKASLDDKLQGLREGIDDYITKPFSATYLKQRVENIIAQRKMLQNNFLEKLSLENSNLNDKLKTGHATSNLSNQNSVANQPSNSDTSDTSIQPNSNDAEMSKYRLQTPEIIDADQHMMQQVMDYLETNIGNSEMKIEDIAAHVHIGRTIFNSKVKAVVGMPPIDFVRHIRLQRAEQLVAGSTMTFSEIAYAIGFSDPKYFSKCFKKETGLTASQYRKAKNEQKNDKE